MSSQDQGMPIDPAHELPSEPATTELSSLAEELRRATEERDQVQDKWLRALAELDNFRKRAARDLSEARSFAAAEAVRPFLTVVDGFERALAHTHAGESGELRTGIELLHPTSRDCIRTAFALYGGILDAVEKADHQVLDRRVAVPLPRRLAVALPGLVRARRARRPRATLRPA